jgi:hypothetical protein
MPLVELHEVRHGSFIARSFDMKKNLDIYVH